LRQTLRVTGLPRQELLLARDGKLANAVFQHAGDALETVVRPRLNAAGRPLSAIAARSHHHPQRALDWSGWRACAIQGLPGPDQIAPEMTTGRQVWERKR